MVADLPAQSNHPLLFVQQEQIAVAAHEFEHQGSLHGFSRSAGKAKLHHPFESSLIQFNKGQLAEAVLQLLGEGASAPHARWGLDLNQPRGFCLPAQFNPHHSAQAAKA